MSVVANVAINIDGKQASAVLDEIKRKVEQMNGTFDKVPQATKNINGITGAMAGLAAQFLSVTAAAALLQKSLATAFERGAAEQRLKTISSSAGEYQAALAAAATTAEKFGISQTEATAALADVYGRLKGVGFGLKETTQIYEGFNVIAKQSNLTGADAAGVFFQLSQALGKGKLNGDEFVSVSERMPGLLDAIAQTTGRSRGELATMAQQGELTSTVLYKALAGSADAAGNLNAKLTDQQKAFNALFRVSDQLLNTIGKVFAPFVIKGAEALAWAGQKLSEWYDYLAGNVLPRLITALQPLIVEFQKIWNEIPWDAIVSYLQGAILTGINRIISAVKFLSPIIAAVFAKFVELGKNPVFTFIAEQIGRLLNHLGIGTNEVSKFTAEQNKAKEATAQTVSQYSSLPSKITDSKDAAQRLKQEVAGIKGEYQMLTSNQDALLVSLDRAMSITQSRYEAEKAYNDLLLNQLKTQLDQAKTQQDRIAISRKIYKVEIANAEAAHKLAIQRIEAEEDRAQIQINIQALKAQELQVELALLRSRKQDTTELERAVKLQDGALRLAIEGERTARQISINQITAANATLLTQKNAAQLAFQQNIAAKAAKEYANNLEQAAAASREITLSTASSITGREPYSQTVDIPEQYIRRDSTGKITKVDMASYIMDSKKLAGFANGGYVKKPMLATVGEAGAEYIVPESKAANFAANYLSGARGVGAIDGGAASPVINITTGPVMQQGGQNYVTIQDMEAGLQAVADTILSNSRSYSARRFTGVV